MISNVIIPPLSEIHEYFSTQGNFQYDGARKKYNNNNTLQKKLPHPRVVTFHHHLHNQTTATLSTTQP